MNKLLTLKICFFFYRPLSTFFHPTSVVFPRPSGLHHRRLDHLGEVDDARRVAGLVVVPD